MKCVYVCVCSSFVCVRECVFVSVSLMCICLCLCVCEHAYVYAYAHVHMRMCVCVRTHVYAVPSFSLSFSLSLSALCVCVCACVRVCVPARVLGLDVCINLSACVRLYVDGEREKIVLFQAYVHAVHANAFVLLFEVFAIIRCMVCHRYTHACIESARM